MALLAGPPRGALLPLAVGRTAVAVRALPDSGLVVRLTRGRAWIAVLGTLLTGIVALNVGTLTLGASSGRVDQQIQGLEQENLALRSTLAQRLSNERVQEAATQLGMLVPTTRRYLRADGTVLGDAGPATPVETEPSSYAPAVPVASLPAEPVQETDPVATATATPAETTTAPAPTEATSPAPAATEPTVPVAPAGPAGTSGGGVTPG